MKAKLEFTYGVFEQPQKDENLLYYYCSMETFTSIIKSKSIWLRNLLTMNDPSELLLHKVNIAEQIFIRYKQNPFEFKYANKENEDAMHAYLWATHFVFTSGFNNINNNLFFAICMSSEENSLAQWRMYADNGKGVCLGFDKRKILDYIKDNADYQLQEIEYYENIKSVVDKVCSIILEKIKKIYNSNDEEQLKQFMGDISSYCMPEWSKYKTSDYSGEKETRLVYKKHTEKMYMNIDASDIDSDFLSDLDWSIARGQLDLHTKISISDLGLSTITLGPLNNTSKGLLNILLAKENVKVPHNKLYKSTIPYRG